MDPRMLIVFKTLALLCVAAWWAAAVYVQPAQADTASDNQIAAAKIVIGIITEACNTGDPVEVGTTGGQRYFLVCKPSVEI
jgi:hypothetical protein